MTKRPNEIADIEDAAFGSILMDESAIDKVRGIGLRPEHFSTPMNRTIMTTMCDMADKNIPIDTITLADRSKIPSHLLFGLSQKVPSASNVVRYAELIIEAYRNRQLEQLAGWIQENVGKNTANETAERVASSLEKLTYVNRAKSQTLAEQIEETHQRIMDVRKPPTTGYLTIDDFINGFNKDLIVVAARPSMGKTALVTNMVTHGVLKQELHCAFFSLEMRAHQILNRIISSETAIPLGFLRQNKATADQWMKIIQVSDQLLKSGLELDDNRALNIPMLRTKCRMLNRKRKLDVVVIDYLQLMLQHEEADSRANEIALITRALGELKEELDCTVMVLSQLSRECEKRGDKRPILSDLRDSGAIESDADVVMFLYRDSYYKETKKEEAKATTEIHIAKNRNGDTGRVNLYFDKYCTRFHSDTNFLNNKDSF